MTDRKKGGVRDERNGEERERMVRERGESDRESVP